MWKLENMQLENGIELKGKAISQFYARLEKSDNIRIAENLAQSLQRKQEGRVIYQKFRNGRVVDQITSFEV